MKILFLDFDGVLNSTQSFRRAHRNRMKRGYKIDGVDDFCPINCSNLQSILEACPDLDVVVSSSWRVGNTLDEMKELLKLFDVSVDRFVDVTPRLPGQPRGNEIQKWLTLNDQQLGPIIEKFAIVDDDSDMAHLKEFLFQTSGLVGLDLPITQRIINYFKGVKND